MFFVRTHSWEGPEHWLNLSLGRPEYTYSAVKMTSRSSVGNDMNQSQRERLNGSSHTCLPHIGARFSVRIQIHLFTYFKESASVEDLTRTGFKTIVVKPTRETIHDDVIKWKHFPRYWPFVRGIHRSPVHFPHKGRWRGALMFSLICVWINDWVNHREAGDLRRHRTHYDVTLVADFIPRLDRLRTA